MKYLVCSLVWLFGWMTAVEGQELRGKILESGTEDPLSGVEVMILPSGDQTTTDNQGEFTIGIGEEESELVCWLPGYEILRIPVRNDSGFLTLSLSIIDYEATEVVISAQKRELFGIRRMQDVEGTAIYAGKKNEVVVMDLLTANIPSNNPRQIYAQVAGLNIFETNDAGLQLNIGGRGLDPNRSAHFNTRQNGYDISADALGYPESYYTPPAEALKEIQVIRGAASLQYGPQFGGLVNFRFKDPVSDKKLEWVSRQSIGSFGLFTSFNSLSGTVGKVGYYGYIQGKVGNGFRPNSGFEALNGFAHARIQLAERTSLETEFTYLNYLAQQPGGLTDAQFTRDPVFSNRERNWFEVNWHLISLKLKHQWENQSRLSVNLYGLDASRAALGFRSFRVSQVDDPANPRDFILGTFRNLGLEARYLRPYSIAGNKAVALLGARAYKASNTAVQGAGPSGSDPDFQFVNDQFPEYPNQSDFRFPNTNAALFGEHIFTIADHLTITPGFRLEHIDTRSEGSYKRIDFDLAGNPIRDTTFTDNRDFERQFMLLGLGLAYRPAKGPELYANFSQNYRSVTFSDIRIVNPSFQIDPDISDERGFTADAGARGAISDWLSYEIGGFGLLYDNRLGEVLRAETVVTASGSIRETGRVIRYRGNIGRALMVGAEGLLDWNIRKLFFPSSYQWKASLFTNLAITHSAYLNSEIAGVQGSEVEFVPLVNLKTGLNLGYRNLILSTQFTHISEQFTDATNAEQVVMDNQSGIQGAIPAYSILDCSGSWTWEWLKVEAGINNVMNERYFTQRATGYPGPGIIPSAPRSWYFAVQLTF